MDDDKTDELGAAERGMDEAAADDPRSGGEADDPEVEVWVIDDEAADPSATPGGSPPANEVEKLRKELAEVKDQWVRTLADLDNYRKRAEREVRDARRYALFDPLRDLLAVADNLERAIGADGSTADLKRGVEMILSQLREVMRAQGVREVSAAGQPFDPAVHDAIARYEDAQVEVPTVSEELQRGYILHERLLRPALVRVAMPSGTAGGS